MSGKRNSREAREICRRTHLKLDEHGREYMICHCCGVRFHPKITAWRADHYPRRWSEGGRNTPDNLMPILRKCDEGREGKAAADTRQVAHGRRVAEKSYGWRRASRPMAGSRDSPWKKRMDGTVVRR